jgi:hypothetical protein
MPRVTIDTVRDFLLAVDAGDALLRERIENLPGEARFDGDKFVFSLEALWRLCDPESTRDLAAFRQMLYASELNRELRELELEVAIYRGTGKVGSNLYCLKAT